MRVLISRAVVERGRKSLIMEARLVDCIECNSINGIRCVEQEDIISRTLGYLHRGSRISIKCIYELYIFIKSDGWVTLSTNSNYQTEILESLATWNPRQLPEIHWYLGLLYFFCVFIPFSHTTLWDPALFLYLESLPRVPQFPTVLIHLFPSPASASIYPRMRCVSECVCFRSHCSCSIARVS